MNMQIPQNQKTSPNSELFLLQNISNMDYSTCIGSFEVVALGATCVTTINNPYVVHSCPGTFSIVISQFTVLEG